MALLDRIAARFGFHRGAARRDFSAAQLSRLTGGWSSSNISANADLYRNLDVLRARSRDLCNNNDYAKRFLGMVSANVVGGNGFTLQSRIYDGRDKPDGMANDAVESAWSAWCRRGVCDVSGRLSFRDVQILVAKTCARDGEALVRKVLGKSSKNPFGFALQVIDIDRLDTRLIRPAGDGRNEIRMGVEVDEYGRSIAYWLRGYHPGDTYGVAPGAVESSHIRVPAEEILHVYQLDRPEQLRGTPWMHAAMTRLNNLGGYEEAAVIAARVGASKMGFFTTPDGLPPSDGEDAEGVPYMEADPGSFGVLPNGVDFKPFDPDYPTAMYGDFIKACLRGISSGLGVSYHALANDLEGVNFSSIRSGTLEERDQWISIQEWFKDAFIDPVFNEWLGYALAFGQIVTVTGKPLPIEKKDKFSGHIFQGRRWQWVDPLKDINASLAAIRSGLADPYTIAGQMGVDLEDVIASIARANAAAEASGLPAYAERPKQPVNQPSDPAATKADIAELVRSLGEKRPADPVVFHNHIAQPNVTIGDTRIDNHLPAPSIEVAAPQVEIRNEIELPEQPAPQVEVTVEAVMPEQIAPAIEVNVELPDEIKMAITAMPERVTETTVSYDSAGDIRTTTQVEKDGIKE